MRSAGRRDLCAALALLCVSVVGCDAPRGSAPAEVWSAREIRRTPLSSGIAEEEIGDIEWATDSTLFVAIDGGKQLLLLGWDGTIRHRVSRQGNGPGETQFVGWLARIPSGDSLVVSVDLRQFRVAWWTPEGELVRERPFDAALGARRIFVGVRLLTRKSGVSREYLGLGGAGSLTGAKSKGLGVFYIAVGLTMILLVVGVRVYRGHW